MKLVAELESWLVGYHMLIVLQIIYILYGLWRFWELIEKWSTWRQLQVLGSAQRAMLSWLSLAQIAPGERFVGGETFGIQRLVSEIELFLHGLDQTSSWFMNKILGWRLWQFWHKVEIVSNYYGDGWVKERLCMVLLLKRVCSIWEIWHFEFLKVLAVRSFDSCLIIK